MVDGRLQVSGQSEAAANAEKLEWKRQEEMTDALGNVVRAPCCLFSKGARCAMGCTAVQGAWRWVALCVWCIVEGVWLGICRASVLVI